MLNTFKTRKFIYRVWKQKSSIKFDSVGQRHFSSLSVKSYLLKLSQLQQNVYNKTFDMLLTNKVTRPFVRLFIRLLFRFHYVTESLYCYFGEGNINMASLFLSGLTSRLHIGGWLIVVCMIILRLQASFRKVARYYKADMSRLNRDFPNIHMDKRYMGKVNQAIIDALENPRTQAVVVAVGGAIAWKAMDLWDTTKNAEIADKDRVANMLIADKDRTHASQEAQKERNADNARHREMLEAEATQRQLDRDAEDLRHRETLTREDARHRETLEAEAIQRQLDRESTERLAQNADEFNSSFVD
jgi:hypothetical protein